MANEMYRDLLGEMWDIHVQKADGYSGVDAPDTWVNFREATQWGATPLQGVMIRMGDKYRRAQTIMRHPEDAGNEPLEETLMDLAAYALIGVCLLRERSISKMVKAVAVSLKTDDTSK